MPTTPGYKERKAGTIEINWGCRIQDALPADIRPRNDSTGRKCKVSDAASFPELPLQEWSLKLLIQLSKLSSITKGKLAFAQELMMLEVRQRQANLLSASNGTRGCAELLLGDVERINKDLRDHSSVEPVADDEDSGEDEDEDENEYDDQGSQHGEQIEAIDFERRQNVRNDTPVQRNEIPQETTAGTGHLVDIKRDYADAGMDTVTGAQCRTRELGPKTPTRAMVRISKANLQKQAKISRLRADAMRLKQEAAKRKAEAYELEAKMLSAEANQVEQLDTSCYNPTRKVWAGDPAEWPA